MDSRLQKGKVVYKTGISFTKVDFRLQIGTLEIQTGLSGCYVPSYFNDTCTYSFSVHGQDDGKRNAGCHEGIPECTG